MPYQTKALWEPVLTLMENEAGEGRRLISSVEYGKAVPKYLADSGTEYEKNLSPQDVNALKAIFIQHMTSVRNALNDALA